MSTVTGEEAMVMAGRQGHELGPLRVALAASAGWSDLWESRCLYCGARLVVYRGQMSPSQSDDRLEQPCVAAVRLAGWRAEQRGAP